MRHPAANRSLVDVFVAHFTGTSIERDRRRRRASAAAGRALAAKCVRRQAQVLRGAHRGTRGILAPNLPSRTSRRLGDWAIPTSIASRSWKVTRSTCRGLNIYSYSPAAILRGLGPSHRPCARLKLHRVVRFRAEQAAPKSLSKIRLTLRRQPRDVGPGGPLAEPKWFPVVVEG